MEIFGYIVCALFMLYVGFIVVVTILNNGGTCTIGGSPNTWYQRLFALFALPLIYVYLTYYLLVLQAPFEIIIKGI